jgi:hypothetical protein
MKKLDHNALYRYYVLLIVYSYITARGIIRQVTRIRTRAAMAEPPFIPIKTASFFYHLYSSIFLQNNGDSVRWLEHK